jgi:hypothetical protein
LVTTYQASKLVLLRADEGVVNTHFRSFPKPMGLAVRGNRLAIGTALEVRSFTTFQPSLRSWNRPASTMPVFFPASATLRAKS